MEEFFTTDLKGILLIFLVLSAIGIGFALLLLVWVLWRVKRIQIPPDADFKTTLRATPLSVVLLLDMLDLDMLDLGFDFLAAPFAWVLLGHLNLHALRGVTVVESVIPGTQFIPTMTAAWIFVRLTGSRLK